MQTMRAERAAGQSAQGRENDNTDTADEGAVGGEPEEVERASPESLRRDTVIMRQASRRLARLRQEDWKEGEDVQMPGARLTSKKSGWVMTVADIVIKRINWPHFYIKRISDATRKGVVFKELKVKEFVFGFLCMLEPTPPPPSPPPPPPLPDAVSIHD